MQVTGLFHVAIKTNDLDATVKFYTEVLGMKLVHRPDFGFPGAWIAAGDSVPIIHIYAGGPALGADGKTPYGTSALDHVSLTIKGWDECLERVQNSVTTGAPRSCRGRRCGRSSSMIRAA